MLKDIPPLKMIPQACNRKKKDKIFEIFQTIHELASKKVGLEKNIVPRGKAENKTDRTENVQIGIDGRS